MALLHALTYSQAAQESKDVGGLATKNIDINLGIDLAINKPSEDGPKTCDGPKCDEKCSKWAPWSPWSKCTASCGGGKTARIRVCESGNVGEGTETVHCNEHPCGECNLDFNPCQNGGHPTAVICECKPGWTGHLCLDRLPYPDPCKSDPCLNGGTCVGSGGEFTCQCPPGFEGPTCGTEIPDPCKPDPCLNGGTCHVSGKDFTCECPPEWEGPTCQDDTKFIPKCNETCSAKPGESVLFFQYPFTAVMDTTKSQIRWSEAIKRTMQRLKIEKAKKFQLVEFKDDGQLNGKDFKVYDQTEDRNTFNSQISSLDFHINNSDFPERMFKGLLAACKASEKKAIITVTTDDATKDLGLEREIAECLKEKKATLIICMNPGFSDATRPKEPNIEEEREQSKKVYERLTKATNGTLLNADKAAQGIEEVARGLEAAHITVIWENCRCDGPPPIPKQSLWPMPYETRPYSGSLFSSVP